MIIINIIIALSFYKIGTYNKPIKEVEEVKENQIKVLNIKSNGEEVKNALIIYELEEGGEHQYYFYEIGK